MLALLGLVAAPALRAPLLGAVQQARPPRRAASPACVDVSTLDPATTGAVAAAIAGAAAYAYSKSDGADSVSAPSTSTVAAVKYTPPKPTAAERQSSQKWKPVGGGSSTHRGAGRWARQPARKLWVPPKGWEPPTKPVSSWYDRGDRLVPDTPEPKEEKPAKKKVGFFEQIFGGNDSGSAASTKPVGGGSGQHRGAGRWKKPAPREIWVPPPGWEPPKVVYVAIGGPSGTHRGAGRKAVEKPPMEWVESWYDKGKRL